MAPSGGYDDPRGEEFERIEGAEGAARAAVYPPRGLAGRTLGDARLRGEFADVGRSRSLRYLRAALSERLVEHGVADLDAAAVRLSAPRRLTQEVARSVFECAGAPQFSGVRYRSRLGDDIVNWALFERSGAGVVDPSAARIERDDPDLLAALAHLDLRLS